MSIHQAPSASRVQIGFFGLRNAGKSSLVNAVTGQRLSVVSDVPGTTTDPVRKSMELLPIGPVVVIDTPGYDDGGALGTQRVRQARKVLDGADVAVLVVDAARGLGDIDRELMRLFAERDIPHIVALNKSDLPHESVAGAIEVSAATGAGVDALKEKIGALAKGGAVERRIVGDRVRPLDVVVLVTPIDAAAPKGRIILPQQQVLRELLEAGALTMVVRDTELQPALARLGDRAALVITDSQAFGAVSKIVPEEIPLTSFSILFAHRKGFLETAVRGVSAIDRLRDGDTVLIGEGCTHHRQCDDIGAVKLPNWLSAHTGRELQFAFSSGGDFLDDLSRYAAVVHCGGCMQNERELLSRMRRAVDQRVPFTNYGVAIAHMHGLLRRSLCLFPALRALL